MLNLNVWRDRQSLRTQRMGQAQDWRRRQAAAVRRLSAQTGDLAAVLSLHFLPTALTRPAAAWRELSAALTSSAAGSLARTAPVNTQSSAAVQTESLLSGRRMTGAAAVGTRPLDVVRTRSPPRRGRTMRAARAGPQTTGAVLTVRQQPGDPMEKVAECVRTQNLVAALTTSPRQLERTRKVVTVRAPGSDVALTGWRRLKERTLRDVQRSRGKSVRSPSWGELARTSQSCGSSM